MKKTPSKIKAFLKKIEFEPLTRGQKYGTSTTATTASAAFNGAPTRKKSLKR